MNCICYLMDLSRLKTFSLMGTMSAMTTNGPKLPLTLHSYFHSKHSTWKKSVWVLIEQMEKTTLQASSSSFMRKQTQSFMEKFMELNVLRLCLKIMNKFYPSNVQKNLRMVKINTDRLLSSAKIENKLKDGYIQMVKHFNQL